MTFPAFSRTVAPWRGSWPQLPDPMVAVGQSGRTQLRDPMSGGLSWTEEWAPLLNDVQANQVLMSRISRWRRAGQVFTITPYSHQTALGTITTGVAGAVNGAGQSGASLVTSGWASDGTILEGSYVTIVGFPFALMISADVTVAAGAATLSLDPSIYVGREPADAAVVTLNGPLTAYLASKPSFPSAFQDPTIYAGLKVSFREVVTTTTA